jgi:hypothetical protein
MESTAWQVGQMVRVFVVFMWVAPLVVG